VPSAEPTKPTVPAGAANEVGDSAEQAVSAPRDPVSPPSVLEEDQLRERSMPTSQPILLRAFRWGLIGTIALVATFGIIGWLVSGSTGLIGGVIGAAIGG